MYSLINSIKLWIIVGTLILAGCTGIQSTPELNAPVSYETEVYHYVDDPGETIEEIAQRYGRSVEEIAQWNGLFPPYKLEVHQKLLVSGPPSGQAIIPDEPISRQPIYSRAPRSPKKTSYQPTVKSCTGKTYLVQPGDTVYSIAKRCKKSDHDIAQWNNLSPPYVLKVGKKIWVSSPPTTVVNVPSYSSPGQEKYTVQAGDTLYSIAKKLGRSMAEIKAWNNLSSSELPLGKTLVLKSPQHLVGEPQSSKPTASSKGYVVQPGDTLYRVAKRTGYPIKDIMAWNKLSSPHLPVGQKLVWGSSPSRENKSFSCHKVIHGETLFSIAKSYGYQVKEIAQWNTLFPPYTLEKGRYLRVSPQIKSCR